MLRRSKVAPYALGASMVIVLGIAIVVLMRSREALTDTLACGGKYADSLLAQSARVRDIEQGPRGQYSYLIRSTARYECPLFGADGKLKKRTVDTIEHGTAFAYEAAGDETYLLTNEHVAVWPEVTTPDQKEDGVPEGCKRVDVKLRIVADEKDEEEDAHIVLTTVAVDPTLDAAILRAKQRLAVMPYRLGRSASLRPGNAVVVRGFPLGVMQAVNTGKVVNPYDRDQEKGWDHVDFVIDAILSEGNSGSPVLALSCTTRALELVGMFHAGYKGHNALNVVVGIDELSEFMARKRRVVRAANADPLVAAEGAAARARLAAQLGAGTTPLFEYGGLTVRLTVSASGAPSYFVYGPGFPLDDRAHVVIEEAAVASADVAPIARAWFGVGVAQRAWTFESLGAEERESLIRALRSLRLQALRTFEHREATAQRGTPDGRRRLTDLDREMRRSYSNRRELANLLLDMAERLGPTSDDGQTHSDVVPVRQSTEDGRPPTPPPLPPAAGAPAVSEVATRSTAAGEASGAR